VVGRAQILDVGVANEAARFGHDVDRQSCQFGYSRVKILCRLAVQRRPGQRRQVIREREMFRLRQRVLAECAFALELGRGKRGQLQRSAERIAVAAERERAIKHWRGHQDPGNENALVALQQTRDFGGAKATVALAQDEFRRTGSAVLGDVQRDDFRHRLGVAVHAPECPGAIGLGGPAPASADGIDQDEIGESEPGLRIVHQTDIGAVTAVHAELGDPRADQPEVQKRRCGARAAVEHERHRPCRRTGRFRRISRIEDRSRPVAGLIEQRKRPGRRGIGELAAGKIDAVLGNGVRRQERKHAGAAWLLASAALLCFVLVIALAATGAILRNSRTRRGGEQECNKQIAKIDHDRFLTPTFLRNLRALTLSISSFMIAS
jgi:hypothetical protein